MICFSYNFIYDIFYVIISFLIINFTFTNIYIYIHILLYIVCIYVYIHGKVMEYIYI